MSGEELAVLNFDRVFQYALRVSERYRRNLALVMMSGECEQSDFSGLIAPLVRRSDELLELRDCAAVLMGETNGEGALQAVQRFKRSCPEDAGLRYAVACFPDDGKAASMLLLNARRRLDVARGQQPGTVVSAD